ncbi:hypothetical protein ColTof4_11570 [Colletotrichum tofieldiae]|nr:hypothetical protein ColTof3_03358 [Colletotrichum tofieldiae]GKT79148.1 hypothetical protein ColTof4_11570 [Colletotrichum tofieldiae]
MLGRLDVLLYFNKCLLRTLQEAGGQSDGRCIHHADEAEGHEGDVAHLFPPRLGNALVVQVRGVDVDQRHAGKGADERDEAVQVGRAGDGNADADGDERRAEGVLLPLGQEVLLAGAVAKDLALEDAHGREQLDGVADEDGEGVHELHGVDEAAVLRVVVDDFDLCAVAKGGVAQGADGGEDAGDEQHDAGQQGLKVLGPLHARLDGDDEADALKGEDGGADGEGVGARVEELDGRVHAAGGEGRDVVPPDVGDADDDEDVGEQGGRAELGDVADEGEGHDDDGLQGDEGGRVERVGAAGDGLEEREPVVGDEDEAGADEADLGQGDGGEDEGAHARARDVLAEVAVAAAVAGAALQQEVEGGHGDGGDDEHGQRGEEDAAVLEGLGEEHDAGADEGLEGREEGFCGRGVAGLAGEPRGAPSPEEGTGLGGRAAALSRLLVVAAVVVVVVGLDGLLVGIREVLAGKGAVEVEELDKVARDGQVRGGEAALLHDELAAEALGHEHLGGGGEVGFVARLGAARVRESLGALDALIAGRDLEEAAVDVAAGEEERRGLLFGSGGGVVIFGRGEVRGRVGGLPRQVAVGRGPDAVEAGAVPGREVVRDDGGAQTLVRGRGCRVGHGGRERKGEGA